MTASNWRLPVYETIEIAWKKLYGVKTDFWKAIFLSLVIVVIVNLLSTYYIGRLFPVGGSVATVVLQILSFLFQMGLIFMGIQCALGAAFTWCSMFESFEGFMSINLLSVYLMQICIALIPIILLMIGALWYQSPHFYLQVIADFVFAAGLITIYYLFLRMIMSVALVLDQKENPWDAIKQSFHLTRGNVMRLIALNLLQYLIFAVSVFTFFGLIWGLPFCYVLYGCIYKQLKENRSLVPAIKH